jgi:hypothetical protein
MNRKKEVCERIAKCCDELGTSSLLGIPLENADPRFLDIREANLDEHVAVQPAAIAFFGSLKKDAMRQLDKDKREYEKWKMEKYAEAKRALKQEGRVTIADIEAKMVADNRNEVDGWEEQIRASQENVDVLDVYYEAWKQKAFCLNQYAELTSDELFAKENISMKVKLDEKKGQIRDIIRHRHGKKSN